jgi:hypothetical protein
MVCKNTSRLYYCCLHSPLASLNEKNFFFLLILSLRARQQLGIPPYLSLKKSNFAHSLCFVFRVINNNNKQLLLSNTSLASFLHNGDAVCLLLSTNWLLQYCVAEFVPWPICCISLNVVVRAVSL